MYDKQAKSKRQRVLCAMYKDFAKTDNATYRKDTVFADFNALKAENGLKKFFQRRKGLVN